MSIKVDDGFMSLEVGRVVATARERTGGWWGATTGPVLRLQPGDHHADTTELLESGRGSGDPLVAALRKELG